MAADRAAESRDQLHGSRGGQDQGSDLDRTDD